MTTVTDTKTTATTVMAITVSVLVNDNETTTTTVTFSTTMYSPMDGNSDTNRSTTTTTTTTSATTTTTYSTGTTSTTTTATTTTTSATTTSATTTTATTTATTTSASTSTLTATTTATETLSDNEETVLVFEMTITLSPAQGSLAAGALQFFLVNPQIKDSFEESMAERLNVPTSWVHAELVATRRLSEDSAPLRRLASVTILYTITIPSPPNLPDTGLGSAVTPAAVQSGISSTSTLAFTTALDHKLTMKGVAGDLSIAVNNIGTITVEARTLTTTSTWTKPSLEDDSFAFTKVALTPVYVFALLAMVLMAMSS
mmetsp:Transcript_39201/g.85331  ORF Transcript_39201/g.85331 Transcript_39201/m.85331 type:complete len:315 (+) Transcript_39201:3-947(+)